MMDSSELSSYVTVEAHHRGGDASSRQVQRATRVIAERGLFETKNYG